MKIYRKLYLWFLLVFILTIAVVSIMVHTFYTERVRDELQGQLQSHARFLLAEYQEACKVHESASCQRFLRRLQQIRPLRFWIVNSTGQVLLSNERQNTPLFGKSDLEKARKGEVVIMARHRTPPYVMVPLKNPDGSVRELAVIERGFARGGRFPRFPFFASLIVVLITIAIFIFPLSKRLTKPLRELHRLGQDWSEGRLENRAKIRGKDEIAELAGTFNTMAENLQKMLQQRKEFLASISHEMKSPLARMRIALELLNEKTTGQSDVSKLLNNIEQEIAESEALIEQLLLLSKVEMNPPLSREPVSLEKLTKRAVEQIQPLAEQVSVKFRIHGEAKIHGDYSQVERAILNVLENSIKFSGQGDLVEVHMLQRDGFAVWKCVDQGRGIEASETEKIFQPFYRGKGAGAKDGSGLGLFIARRIVEMHGGKIRAFNNERKGMTIEIQLPL